MVNTTTTKTGTTIAGKPVTFVKAASVLSFGSMFKHKQLCDGTTLSAGSSCAYSCAYCYVPSFMRKSPHVADHSLFTETVIRRSKPEDVLMSQLFNSNGKPRFDNAADKRVVISSPLVDPAPTVELADETARLCSLILKYTHWQIRVLSKSTLLPRIAKTLDSEFPLIAKRRMIFGVSTGIVSDAVSRVVEAGTPLVSKRAESIRSLQDDGWRTYGMICPSLPQLDYDLFVETASKMIRTDRMENVWGEALNSRGESYLRTITALRQLNTPTLVSLFGEVMTNPAAWEEYARATFEAHVAYHKPGQLRFLQYVTNKTRGWWQARESDGALSL